MANLTIIGTLTLLQNFNTISVTCTYTNDDNSTMTAVVEYKPSAGSTWSTAFTPYIDRLAQVWMAENSTALSTNPRYKEVRTSIFGLSRNTAYDVRVTFTDADGVTGTNPATASATTWSHDQPTTGGTTYYVDSATGSDSDDGLSMGTAWLTISKANTTVAAGDTVKLLGSFGTFSWSTSGTAGAYIKIESNDHGSMATVTAAPAAFTADYVWVTYVSFRDVTLTGTAFMVFDHNTVLGNGTASRYGAILLNGDNPGLLIATNTITNNNPALEYNNGIYIQSASTGRIVIRYNTITTTYDGIGGAGNFGYANGFDEGSDIHYNTITKWGDDGIESEGGNVNTKIWSNYIHDTAATGLGHVGIANAACNVGPMYILNNVIYNTTVGTSYGWKFGSSMGKAYWINNTVWNVNTGGADSGGPFQNGEFYNNLYYVNSGTYILELSNVNSTVITTNYNNADVNGTERWKIAGTQYNSFAAYQATGREANGLNVASLLVNPTADLSLQAGSPLVNAGTSFNGIAVDFTGATRSGSWDIGAYEYGSSDVTPPAAPTGVSIM